MDSDGRSRRRDRRGRRSGAVTAAARAGRARDQQQRYHEPRVPDHAGASRRRLRCFFETRRAEQNMTRTVGSCGDADPTDESYEIRKAPMLKVNRSIPASTVIPVLIYPDVRARGRVARRRVRIRRECAYWRRPSLAASRRRRRGHHRRRSQRPPTAAVGRSHPLGDGPSRERGRGISSRRKVRARVIVMPPTNFEYGERQYTVEDLGGHRWTFSETLEDVAPETWGGISVSSP